MIAASPVLEVLDKLGGRVDVDELAYQLERRGHELDDGELAGLIDGGLVERRGEEALLTDRGAASIEGPVEDLPAPTEEPDPEPPEEPDPDDEEEPVVTRTIEEHRQSSNGAGKTRDRVLALLSEHPDGLRPKQVAEMLGMSTQGARDQLNRLRHAGETEVVPLGSSKRAGTLYFIAGQAKVRRAPDLKATTRPKSPAKRTSAPRSEGGGITAPSDRGELDRYLGLLGRLAIVEAPSAEVLGRLERMLELDARVRGPDHAS